MLPFRLQLNRLKSVHLCCGNQLYEILTSINLNQLFRFLKNIRDSLPGRKCMQSDSLNILEDVVCSIDAVAYSFQALNELESRDCATLSLSMNKLVDILARTFETLNLTQIFEDSLCSSLFSSSFSESIEDFTFVNTLFAPIVSSSLTSIVVMSIALFRCQLLTLEINASLLNNFLTLTKWLCIASLVQIVCVEGSILDESGLALLSPELKNAQDLIMFVARIAGKEVLTSAVSSADGRDPIVTFDEIVSSWLIFVRNVHRALQVFNISSLGPILE